LAGAARSRDGSGHDCCLRRRAISLDPDALRSVIGAIEPRVRDPDLQRRASAPPIDPIRQDSGETNLYRYAAGDTANVVDPTGLDVFSDALDVIGTPFDVAANGVNWIADETGLTGVADNALDYYVDVATDPRASWLARTSASAAGLFASLVACDNAGDTALTLASGGAAGSALGKVAVKKKLPLVTVGKLAKHGAHHSFPVVGKRPHIQVNFWIPGKKGSGWNLPRIPLP
jgi:hypothetical protein